MAERLIHYHSMSNSSGSNQTSKRTHNRNSPSKQPKKGSPSQRKHHQASKHCTVYVSNLLPNTPRQRLQRMFSKCGALTDISIVSKQKFSFAFVVFQDHKATRRAIDRFNGEQLNGRQIRCQMSKPHVYRKRCYKCGKEGHFGKECWDEVRQQCSSEAAQKLVKSEQKQPGSFPAIVQKFTKHRELSPIYARPKNSPDTPKEFDRCRRPNDSCQSSLDKRSRSRSAELRRMRMLARIQASR